MNDIKIGNLGPWPGKSISYRDRASLDDYEILKVCPWNASEFSFTLSNQQELYSQIDNNNQYWKEKLNLCHCKLIVFHLIQKISLTYTTNNQKKQLQITTYVL